MTRNRFAAVLLAVVAMAGCSYGVDQRSGVSSSLVDFLYPKGEVPPPPSEAIPNLPIPLRVGLAFVPGSDSELTEVMKTQLLERTRTAFSGYDFIKEIVVIPDAYLRSGGGWTSLEQVSRLYQTDVMALVSYDQVANTSENKASLLYWTIVGAYVIPGTDSTVQTFVDTAVFDVQTHKLLFRAPGIHRGADSTTLVNLEEELRKSRSSSFTAAFDDMNKNLDAELGKFRERMKTERVATVTRRSGFGGGSAVEPLTLLLLAVAGLRRRRPA